MAYFGLVPLSTNLLAGQKTATSGNTLQDGDSGGPSYRVYGPSGLVNQGTGTMTLRDTGNVTGATNATPIVITSAAHGLSSGTRVTLSGVGGNTAANGTFTVTAITADTFSLNGSTGNGAYTSGGTWHATGLYVVSIFIDPNLGYASGQTYWFFATWVTSGTTMAELSSFTVV